MKPKIVQELKTYMMTYEYRGSVDVEVKAANEEEAENLGMQEADDSIGSYLSLYDVSAEEIK